MTRCSPLCVVTLVAVATLLAAANSSFAEDRLSGAALLTALRAGGLNLYFRHAQTDHAQIDHARKESGRTSCDPARMRQLSEAGRNTARAVGEAMRALGVPVGKVLSSEFCRAAETARLLDLGTVETTRDLISITVADQVGGKPALLGRLRARLASPPAEGTNTVLVAHAPLIKQAVGSRYPLEGELFVFRPDGKGGFALVASVTPAQWHRWARRSGSDRTPQRKRRPADS